MASRARDTSSSSTAIATPCAARRSNTRSVSCCHCRPDVLRLFFALLPESAQSDALVADVAPLVKELDGQPSPASNLHATLCFVGTVPDEKLAALRAAASMLRARRVTLEFSALDVWDKPQ